MGIFEGVVNFFRGDIDKQTQHVTWSGETVAYTSSFLASVELFIAREFSKLEIDHLQYIKQKDGKYLTRDKLGSDIFEVLNYSPNGCLNNTQWKRELIRRLLRGNNVYLEPKRKGSALISLEFTTREAYNENPADILVITSPVHLSKNASLYDNILTNIGAELEKNKLKGYLKVGAVIGSQHDRFKQEVMEQLKLLQEVSEYNGLGVIDNKSEIIELKNTYSQFDPESVTIIKREILNGFGFSERLIAGEYTDEEYRHFFENIITPIVKELETELTYKLLTTNARVNTGEKETFERITISIDVFKFASVDQLTKLAEANTNGAFLTVNEIRKYFGNDPIAGGDVFRTNLNSTEVKYSDG